MQTKAISPQIDYRLTEEIFKANHGWVTRFCKRAGIPNFMLFWGEEGSVNVDSVGQNIIAVLQKTRSCYQN